MRGASGIWLLHDRAAVGARWARILPISSTRRCSSSAAIGRSTHIKTGTLAARATGLSEGASMRDGAFETVVGPFFSGPTPQSSDKVLDFRRPPLRWPDEVLRKSASANIFRGLLR